MSDDGRRLIEYLPPYWKRVLDLQAICESEENQYEKLRGFIERVKGNFYFSTMDLDTIKQWEEILHVVPDNTLTTEERRQQILSLINLVQPYTIEKLKEILNGFLGTNGYSLDVRPSTYELVILLLSASVHTTAILQMVESVLIKILPAHISFNVLFGTVIEAYPNEYYGCVTNQATIYNNYTTLN